MLKIVMRKMKLNFTLLVLVLSMIGLRMGQAQETYTEQIPGSEQSFVMIKIPGGQYDLTIEGKTYQVELSPYWIAKTEMTHDIFSVFDQDESISRDIVVDAVTRPSPQYEDLTWGMGRHGGYPANSMSLYAAVMVSKWLYTKTGHFYRPPTEAEWQAACLTGKNDDQNLQKIAVFAANSDEKYRKVGSRGEDELGMSDMLGNVAEWTVDAYKEDYQEIIDASASKDPHLVPESRRTSVTLKGGHYQSTAEELGCEERIHSERWWNRRDPQIPKSRWWYTDAAFAGIRLVRPVDQPSDEEIVAYYDKFLQ